MKTITRKDFLTRSLAAAVAAGVMLAAGTAAAQDKMRIAMLVKNLGNGFFDAARDGGLEAAEELGDVELIYTGPTAPTAEGQIDILNSLIAQRVDAIVVSANDANALVPTTRRAMQRGITVLSFDSGIAPEGRVMHLNPSNNELIGTKLVEMASDAIGGEGQIAVLSATAQATNQNIWIEEMRKALAKPGNAGLELVSVVYGDDQSDKSYREALGLFGSHPDLKAIVAPTTVGVAAAAKAVADRGLVGRVFVTGLGLPSEMQGHVESGAVKSFAIWNPIDLGYSATYLAHQIASGKARGEPGEEIAAGRMGTITVGPGGEAAMSEPFTFDEGNVAEFAKIF